jgi:hypothetical protein
MNCGTSCFRVVYHDLGAMSLGSTTLVTRSIVRRSSEDPKVQEKLKEAHHLHRGGLFMLERNE